MAKGLTLSADQAAKFWPMFQAFQQEQKAIIDEQLRAVVKYREGYKSLSDTDALAYANSLLERDQKIHDLRVKYLAKFQQVLIFAPCENPARPGEGQAAKQQQDQQSQALRHVFPRQFRMCPPVPHDSIESQLIPLFKTFHRAAVGYATDC